MINIAFIVGKSGDTYEYKITSKKAPKWLKEGIKPFMEYVNKGNRDINNTVPSDVAMAAYINYKYNVNLTLFNGYDVDDLTQKDLDSQDVIFVIYDAIEVFHCGYRKTCPFESKKFEKMLEKTTAFVYPYPDFHKYIINKPQYYSDLKKADIPIGPYFKVTPEEVIKSPTNFKDKIINKDWNGFIIKPSYAGYSLGIKVIKDIKKTKIKTIKEHFKKLKEKGFPNAVIQKFIPTFGENYEIRTYWINEKYAFSVGTLTEAVGKGDGLPITGFDTFVSEGGTIPDKILNKLKPVAKKAIKSIKQYPIKHPLIRIDFGCCLKTDKCLESYFINEIETMAANLLSEHTDYPVVEKVAEAAYNFALKVKNKSNIKGKKPKVTPMSENIIPCKNYTDDRKEK